MRFFGDSPRRFDRRGYASSCAGLDLRIFWEILGEASARVPNFRGPAIVAMLAILALSWWAAGWQRSGRGMSIPIRPRRRVRRREILEANHQ